MSLFLPVKNIALPADVPSGKRRAYVDNFRRLTNHQGRLFLLAGDQRVEHLNDDFFGSGIAHEDAEPEHLFKIAAGSPVNALASQLGLIARYGGQYRQVNYVVKLNGRTKLAGGKNHDPISLAWHTVDQVVALAKSGGLKIPAVGYTVYVGSQDEAQMLREAAQIVWQAHQAGLLAILWMYPRGQAVGELTTHLTAGAVNVGTALGADFIKVSYPWSGRKAALEFTEVTTAGGTSRVICAGGTTAGTKVLLKTIDEQLRLGGSGGCALGRNLHQQSLADAKRLAGAVAILLAGGSLEKATKLLSI